MTLLTTEKPLSRDVSIVVHFTPDEDIYGCALDCNFMEAEVLKRASNYDTVTLDDDLASGGVVAVESGDGAGEGEPGVIYAEPHVLQIGSVHRRLNLAPSHESLVVNNIGDRAAVSETSKKKSPTKYH